MTAAIGTGASAGAVMLLTAAHHAYGAARFGTPWRYHVVWLSVWVIGALGLLLLLHVRGPKPFVRRAGLLAACALVLLVPVVWIGLFEGGYNHVLKIVLYYGGFLREDFTRLFPPPRYEPPSDWLFELTGVLQLPLAGVAAYWALHLWRAGTRSVAR